jgi:hypothetical protein
MTVGELDEYMIQKGYESALIDTPEYEILEARWISYPINDYERLVIYFEYDGELVKITKVEVE